LKELEVWWFNWTWNCLINEIRDLIVKCQKFKGQIKNSHFVWNRCRFQPTLFIISSSWRPDQQETQPADHGPRCPWSLTEHASFLEAWTYDLPGFIKARERPHREKDRLKNTQRERQKWKKTQEQHSRRERTQNKRGRESQTQRDRVINQRTKNERTKKQENYREQKNPGTRRQTEKKNRSDV
jgi:hypothetical protein